jgi:phage baseplate assembly protein W
MAYGLKQISPLDLKPSTGIGVKLPFMAPAVFTTVYTTKEQLKYNIINYMLTDLGERPMNPNFGMGLRSRLFENITTTTTEELRQSIQTQIEATFPMVQIQQLDVIGKPDTNYIIIQFSYFVKSSKETDSILLKIQNS